ncbi:MAG: lipopolysaccharide transport periplasmic protein LptA [Thiobacillus sp.]|nr:lipopolysaccharide transport periplasmic protein LptA [Thiobacillus sp.]
MNVMLPASTRLFVALCLGCVAAVAHAEKADRDKPVNLEANTVTLDDIRKLSVYDGNVILSQGTLTLRADRVQVAQKNGELDTVTATGRPVAFRQKLDGRDEYIEGFADRIEYNGATSDLELIGQARLRRGTDELRGARISYNASTEFYKVVGQPGAQSPTGRVRAVIRPKPRADQPVAGKP